MWVTRFAVSDRPAPTFQSYGRVKTPAESSAVHHVLKGIIWRVVIASSAEMDARQATRFHVQSVRKAPICKMGNVCPVVHIASLSTTLSPPGKRSHYGTAQMLEMTPP